MRCTARLLAAALLCCAPATAAPAEELLVAAAVSLREPLTQIARSYEAATPGARVQLDFGASSLLAAQIRAGAPVDVFVSADERLVDDLAAQGRIAPEGRTRLAGNRLVVMATRDLAVRLAGAEDLRDPRIRRIAVPDRAVPVGRYAREWLEARGLLQTLSPRLVPTEHARATLAAVDAGNADCAIVYATDARLARDARLAFEIPAAEQPRIVYAAALLAEAQPGARRFLDHLRGPGAARTLATAGFSAP